MPGGTCLQFVGVMQIIIEILQDAVFNHRKITTGCTLIVKAPGTGDFIIDGVVIYGELTVEYLLTQFLRYRRFLFVDVLSVRGTLKSPDQTVYSIRQKKHLHFPAAGTHLFQRLIVGVDNEVQMFVGCFLKVLENYQPAYRGIGSGIHN
ncbi:MAG: hypothetical protein DDT27_01369 [Dehalococcoidia bacterium]|nr:hypothetical protein [Chloroflexota bacterium]